MINIDEKLALLPIIPYGNSEEFQSVLFSDLFNEIFEYYMNNYSNNTLSNKTEVEQRTSLYLYLTNQDEDLANNINDLIYKRPCPTIEEFLDNPFYMGNISATIYPYWRKKLCEIFDPQNPIKKVLFGGATGTGKSRTAEKACVYALYRLLCLRYPRQVLKVEAQSTLAMFILSVTQKTAYQVLFQPFIELLSNMPCFQRVRQARAFENFDTSDPRCPIPFYVEKGNMTIIFPDNIILTLGSQISNTVGYDIVISECDEMNEKGTEEGMELINSIDGRVDGRFMGSPFTFQAVMSSARAKNSVTSEYNKKWKHDPTFLYLRPMRFEVKTGQNFIGDGSYFYVMAGNGVIPSKIVEDPGELAKLKAYEDENNDHKLGLLDCELAPGCETARVPTIYKPSFEADLDQSIQDILGISTQDQSMVFRDTTRIVDKALLPELKMEINLGDNSRLLDFLPDKLFEMDLSGKYRIKRCPQAPRYCFTEDTKVQLLNGNHKTMKELALDYQNGIDNWVYSWSNNGWQIGKIIFAGITAKTNIICEIELDNGEKIKCTPNHKFMLRDGTYCEAQYLKPMTSLMPLYKKESKICSYKSKTYEQILDNNTEKWIYTHKISANIFKENYDKAKQKAKENKSFVVRHHKDFDASNNNPTNLIWLESKDHFLLHSQKGKDHFTKLWNNNEFREKMSIVNSKNGKINSKKDLNNKWHGLNNEDWRNKMKPIQSQNGTKSLQKFNKTERHRKIASNVLIKSRQNPEFNKAIIISRIKNTIQHLIDENIPITPETWNTYKNRSNNTILLKTALKYMGSWEEIIKLHPNYNHKVKNIKFISSNELIDMYDLTIEDSLNCHNFALSAGVVVSNCHVDLSTSGNQCDTGICMLHKEWNINPITQEREIMYIVDFIIYGVAKTKIDLGAVERFLIDLVKERNVPICHVSFDQYQSELILQNLTASRCFTKVEKLSVDRSLEPYTSTASLIELGRVKVGQCDKLKRELEALIIENGKVTRTTELKDMADAIVGSVYSAQYNYKDDPIYQFIPYELQIEKKKIDYKELINEDNLLEEI